ncbi:hypothetical protein RJT34_11981 [Clitoria ternatea]|uniref:Uncharacterized protein n=1 Tax=Clitoria ternatea TaxID=43366 RepID=A0AAN9JKY7_CLITE
MGVNMTLDLLSTGSLRTEDLITKGKRGLSILTIPVLKGVKLLGYGTIKISRIRFGGDLVSVNNIFVPEEGLSETIEDSLDERTNFFLIYVEANQQVDPPWF